MKKKEEGGRGRQGEKYRGREIQQKKKKHLGQRDLDISKPLPRKFYSDSSAAIVKGRSPNLLRAGPRADQ